MTLLLPLLRAALKWAAGRLGLYAADPEPGLDDEVEFVIWTPEDADPEVALAVVREATS